MKKNTKYYIMLGLIIFNIVVIFINTIKKDNKQTVHENCLQDYNSLKNDIDNMLETSYNEGWFEGIDNALKTIEIYMKENKVTEDEYLLILDIVDRIHQEREYWIDGSSEDSQSYYK